MRRATVMLVLLALKISFVPVDCLACDVLTGASGAHQCCAPAHAEKHAGCCIPGTLAATLPVSDHLSMLMTGPAISQIPGLMHVSDAHAPGSPNFALSAPHRPQPTVVLRT